MSKYKIIAIILLNFIGIFFFTYIGPTTTKTDELEQIIEEDEIVNPDTTIIDDETTPQQDEILETFEIRKEKEINKIPNVIPKIKLMPQTILILHGEKYDVMAGVELDTNQNLTITPTIEDTSSLAVGEHSIIYFTIDNNGNKITATRTVKVLEPLGDDDSDGYTNEEEIKNKKDPLDKKDIPKYSKELSIELNNCIENMVVYDMLPDFNNCIKIADQYYGSEGIELNIDTNNIDTNKVGEYTVKVTAYDILKNKTEKEFKFEVLKRDVTILIDDKTSSYLDDITELTSNEKDVTINGTDIGVTLKTDVTKDSKAGNYKITGTWNNKNYNVTFVNGKYTITPKSIEELTEEEIKNRFNIQLNSMTKTYDGQETVVKLAGELPEDIEVEYINNKGINAGTYNVVAKLTGNNNYSGTAELNTTLTINKAPITLQAEDKEIVYGEQPAVLTYTITSGEIFTNDDLMISLKRENNNNVGTYPIVITATNENYDISLIDATYTIKKARPIYSVPTGLKGEEEQTLADITLPEGFEYQEDITVVLSPGTYTFNVKYIPKDTHNYEIITDISVEVLITPIPYYEITFVDKDDNVLSTQTVKRNGFATEPEIEQEYEYNGKNYVFSGWIGNYIDVNADAKITPLYISEETNLTYAYILKPKYYMPDHGEGYESSYYTNALETNTGEKMPLSIKIGGLTESQAELIRQQETTIVALGSAEVNKYLTQSTKTQLESISKGTDENGSYTIEWYVLKFQADGWHLDGYKIYDELTLSINYEEITSTSAYLTFMFNNAVNDVTITIDGARKTVNNYSGNKDIGNEYYISYTKSDTEKTILIKYTFKNIEYEKEYVIERETITEQINN